MPSLAFAAGLGKLTVLSGLGQPLKAEIELLTVDKGEADNISVHLASVDAFRRANIEYTQVLQAVKFGVQQRGEDRYVVVLSSTQPINEPFLDMLVELSWNTGRLVREYTFLLDPPEYKGPSMAAAAVAAPTTAATAKPAEPARAPAPIVERPLAPAPAMKPAPRAEADKTYQVKPGDTLTKIANAHKTESVSLQQMLIALYRSNTDVFDGNNINRMRAGKILNIPDAGAAAAIDQEEATRLVLAQGREFNEYRRALGAAVAGAPERAERRRQSVSGKITAKVEDKPAPAAEAKDQLRLSKGEQADKPGAKRSPQALQEDLVAKDKELKEANERIALLEKNVRDMQKLIELKSQSGAQLQDKAAKPAEPAKAPAAPAAAPPPKPAEAAKAPEAPKAPATPAPTEAAKPAPKPAPKAVVPPPPIPEPSLLEEILNNELAVYGGGGFLILLFIGYGYYAWKRKKAMQQMEGSVMNAPSLPTGAVFAAQAAATTEAAAEEQAAFAQSGAGAAAVAEEVDPIAEAEVYMAYGRDVQAEEILKEALGKNPSRHAIRAKLLEIYFNRKDSKAFESTAMELHQATNGEGPEWVKAVTLGAQLDPGNPLYGDKAAAEAAPAAAPAAPAAEAAPDILLDIGAEAAPKAAEEAPAGLDFDLGLGEPAAGGAQPAKAPAEAPAPAAEAPLDLGFDLDLGAGEKKEEPAPAPEPAPAEAAASIDFDFELPGSAPAPQAQAKAEAPAAEPAPAEGGGIDFDFNLELPEQKAEAPAAEAPLDLSAISLDLGEPGAAAPTQDAHWQEVATKLDLAKAYQEMGDKDGARELLNEVLNEGDAAQKEQAQTLLSSLG